MMQLRPWIVVQDDAIKATKEFNPFITVQQPGGFQSVMTLPARLPANEQVIPIRQKLNLYLTFVYFRLVRV